MAHSIVVDLIAKTGGFSTDLDRASKQLRKFEKEAVAAGKALGTAVAGGAIAAVYAFDKLVKGAADFQDLSETTGASAEDLASLAVAAGTAGVEMSTLAGNASRLTKSLTGVDDESKAAGAAVKALGLNLATFKKLDPVAQIDALTKAFGEFEDGPTKSAVAIALWGKSGTEMLKLMKALEEQGGRTKILTKEQITQADAYADAQAKATTTLKLYAQAGATQLLPALTVLTTATIDFVKSVTGLDAASTSLAANKGLATFAMDAVEWLGDAADKVQLLYRGIASLSLLKDSGRMSAELLTRGEFKAALDVARQARAEAQALWDEPLFSDRLKKARADAAAAGPPPPPKKQLDFEGAVKGDKAKAKALERIAEALKAVNREVETFGQEDDTLAKTLAFKDLKPTVDQLDQYTKALASLRKLRADDAIQKMLDALVAERDALKLSNEQLMVRDLLLKGATPAQIAYALGISRSTEALKAQQDLMKEGKSLTEDMRNPLEVMLARYDRLNELFRTGAIDAVTYRRAVEEAQANYNKAMEPPETKVKELDQAAKDLGMTFSSAFEDAIVEGEKLSDVLKALEKDILRIVWRKLVTEPMAAWISQAANTAGIAIGKSFGTPATNAPTLTVDSGIEAGWSRRAGGGPVNAGQGYMVGERGPELFRPYTAGRVLPNDELGAAPRVEVVNNLGPRAEPEVSRGPEGALRIVLNAVAEDTRRGGVTARATAGRFGVNNGAMLNRRRG